MHNNPVFSGPPLEQGPLPAFFYFALSAEESLLLEPINQPVISLKSKEIRVFSFTLPKHGPSFDNKTAISSWAAAYSQKKNLLEDFFGEVESAIDQYIANDWILPEQMTLGGLSRGGFIASHLAARNSRFKALVAWAPLVQISDSEAFQSLSVKHLDLIPKANQLTSLSIRFYIGNRDVRVHTDHCYKLAREITELSYNEGRRSPRVEFMMRHSIGHDGHGTPQEAFIEGAHWIYEQVGAKR